MDTTDTLTALVEGVLAGWGLSDILAGIAARAAIGYDIARLAQVAYR